MSDLLSENQEKYLDVGSTPSFTLESGGVPLRL